jgi:serine/threonine-protein kinase
MSLPNHGGKPSLTGERTGPYQDQGAVPGSPVGRVQVAVVRRSGLQPVEEIQRLLRKRLRFFALVVSILIAITLLAVVLPAEGIGITSGVVIVGLAVAAGSAWILWSMRPLSLGQLRMIELIVFGACRAVVVWMHYDFFVPQWQLGPREPGFALRYSSLLGFAASLHWDGLIVVYGMFIPNTWRRCAAVVGVVAAIPLVLNTASGLAGGAMEGRALLNLLTILGLNLAAAAALAVYGAYRIERLRQEVVAAHRLGQYQLNQRLGAGGMAEVFLAEHVLLRRPCAIKVIRPERAGDPRHLIRFEREVQTMATLTHPNTVQVFDYGHAGDGTFYYVMEYLPGPTLEELVTKHGPLPPGRAIHFLRQLCGALREAHAIGLIHRDINSTVALA